MPCYFASIIIFVLFNLTFLFDNFITHVWIYVLFLGVISARLPLESSYVDLVIFISRSVEFPADELYAEILRVLTPGGMLVVYGSLQSGTNEADMVKKIWFVTLMDLSCSKTTY